MLAIPRPMLDALDLAPDASVDELLAQCKPPARSSRRDREWATGKAAGRELI
jgi:hypothetical protein